MTFSIGELSRLTGVNVETVRYYERIGLLAAPPRTESGHRVYQAVHVQTLSFIRRGRELGFRIAQIRSLLGLSADSECCAEVREIAASHLADIQAKISDLQRLERLLSETITCCGTAPGCPVLNILAAGQPSDQACQEVVSPEGESPARRERAGSRKWARHE